MATLSEVAYYTRRVLKITFLTLVALLLLRLTISALEPILRQSRPPAPPKADVAFGKLPAIKFPAGKDPTEPIVYTQEFVGGKPPESIALAKVYLTPPPLPNFLSLERSKEFARNLDFRNEPVSLSQTLYQWTDSELPLRTLQKDIVTGNFLLNYDFNKDPSILAEKNLPYGKAAINEAQNIVGGYGLPTPDLEEDGGIVSFLYATSSGIMPVSSVSEANIVRVDLFRPPVDDLPLVPSSYKEAPIYLLFSGSSGKKRILVLRYIFRSVEQGIFATYSLKTTRKAWEELESGKGYIASWGGVKGTHVTIRRVFLAYYDSDTYERYLQPVFVFEGDEDFKAYVPAIVNEWVETE